MFSPGHKFLVDVALSIFKSSVFATVNETWLGGHLRGWALDVFGPAAGDGKTCCWNSAVCHRRDLADF